MITHTPTNLLLIRLAIFLLTYAPLIEALLLFVLLLAAFYLTLYRRHKARLRGTVAQHPNPPTRAEREALFERCVRNVPDWDKYLRLWFQGAEVAEVRRENVREWLGWAFWGRDIAGDGGYRDDAGVDGGEVQEGKELEEEMESYLNRIEACRGRALPLGRGNAEALRLTLDPVEVRYRSVVWYGVVAAMDLVAHFVLCGRRGYKHYAAHPRVKSFPPRVTIPLLRRGRHRSASREIGYYFREHRSNKHLPVVFIHGIGIGMWPYCEFLGELGTHSEDVGVLAVELLPFSARLTSPPLPPQSLLEHIAAILAQHGERWERFVLVAHSYGSVVATHMLRSRELGHRVRGLVLIDPVSVLLHLPDVAYNFTRRVPTTANQWQLWYFASMEMGVAEGLGRHFFWSENIIWREELLHFRRTGGRAASALGAGAGAGGGSGGGAEKRKVAVCLSGKDLIVDTHTVARYLVCDGDNAWLELEEAFEGEPGAPAGRLAPSGLEVLWFPHLDHAQVFEDKIDRKRVVDVISRFCRK
ncbi:hypothetical protein MMYC01_202779 [Madurella mycetomatis]|uniref:AB hydrolase-1 domain-containing protein n=1 Tax=Madurella mycetomatis TaxID=100816 RepID=A0A175WDU0_9PEZI|nr:hypothetical protein MMYC01_202779 [Madurella mycetomatis]